MSIDGLTGQDIEALAARLDGHVKAYPKQSERADVMLAAHVLRAIVAIGLPGHGFVARSQIRSDMNRSRPCRETKSHVRLFLVSHVLLSFFWVIQII